MPECVLCGEHFKRKQVIEGKRRDLSGRVYCLNCSPFGTVNRKRRKQKPREFPEDRKFCATCGRKLKDYRRRVCPVCYTNGYRRRKRDLLWELLGNTCVICGYGGEARHRLLQLHHLDPSKKEFGIDLRAMVYGWARVWLEVEKCILVCPNCHAECGAGLVEKKTLTLAKKEFRRRVRLAKGRVAQR